MPVEGYVTEVKSETDVDWAIVGFGARAKAGMQRVKLTIQISDWIPGELPNMGQTVLVHRVGEGLPSSVSMDGVGADRQEASMIAAGLRAREQVAELTRQLGRLRAQLGEADARAEARQRGRIDTALERERGRSATLETRLAEALRKIEALERDLYPSRFSSNYEEGTTRFSLLEVDPDPEVPPCPTSVDAPAAPSQPPTTSPSRPPRRRPR